MVDAHWHFGFTWFYPLGPGKVFALQPNPGLALGGATVGKVEDAASDGAKVISWIGDHHCVAPAGAGKVRPFGMIWLGNEQVH